MSVSTDLKLSSLACECVFYRPEQNIMQERGDSMELNFQGLLMQKIYQWIELKE